MSHSNESCLRFSLEESVWFQKGQEVAELVSISLDPNITIQENEQYVTIQGALELTGEYSRYDDGTQEEEDLFSSPKFVHHVEAREDGVYEFSHRFPVDITIPNNRIQSLDDIHVEVESFDYLFQERSCMKLTADLTITGLYGDQQHKPVQEETLEEEIQVELAYRSVGVEEQTEEQLESEVVESRVEEQVQEDEVASLEVTQNIKDEVTSLEVTQNEEDEVASIEVTQNKEDAEEYQPFSAEARRIPEGAEEVAKAEELSNPFEAPQVSVNDAKEPEIYFSASRKEVAEEGEQFTEVKGMQEEEENKSFEVELELVESSSSSSPEIVQKQKKKKNAKKGLSLTEFFARKEDGDDLTKLRVAIVQGGETLEQLAARYEIPVQQLLKTNHLELNQDIYEGQVLYIPVVVAHK